METLLDEWSPDIFQCEAIPAFKGHNGLAVEQLKILPCVFNTQNIGRHHVAAREKSTFRLHLSLRMGAEHKLILAVSLPSLVRLVKQYNP